MRKPANKNLKYPKKLDEPRPDDLKVALKLAGLPDPRCRTCWFSTEVFEPSQKENLCSLKHCAIIDDYLCVRYLPRKWTYRPVVDGVHPLLTEAVLQRFSEEENDNE